MKRRGFLIGGGMFVVSSTTGSASQPLYPAPEGLPGAPFADVNLKLAVLSALNDKRIIDLGRPPQLAEHVLRRSFDVEREGHRPVPAALDYLARYPLSPALLGAVETLDIDGGSSIYHHIWHFWHGEDDTFDIRKLDGIENCSNLRNVNVASMLSAVDIVQLTPMRHLTNLNIGVDTKNIAALLDIPTLESVRILNDGIYAEVTSPGHPTRLVMDKLKQRGVRVWVHWVSQDHQAPAFE